ncbi:MAG: LamG domain-containing protein, partial [Planctomycetota bacterium]
MWIAAAGAAGILLLAVVAYVALVDDSSDGVPPPAPEAETAVTDEPAAETPARDARVTLTPVAQTPAREPRDAAGHVDRGLESDLVRESEERGARPAADDGAASDVTGADPDIAELLAAAEGAPAAPATATGIRRGLVAHWTFDEGRGAVAKDTSGRGVNGTVTGGRWVKGRIGNALNFDGVDDRVMVANESNFDIRSAITVAAWVKIDSFSKYCEAIVCKGDTAWRLHRHRLTNSLGFACNGLTGTPILQGNASVVDGEWHHVAGVYDGTTMYLYVDGRMDASAPARGDMATSDAPVHIGDNSEKTKRRWCGAVDDVRVYERALSAGEIGTLADPARLAAAERGAPAEAGTPRVAPRSAPPPGMGIRQGLVGHWTFDEVRGAVATDTSGRGANGTVRAVKWVEGRIGRGALFFNGVNGSVRITGYKGITGKAPRTVAAWVRTNSGDENPIISWGAGKKGRKYILRLDPDTHALEIDINKGWMAGSTTVDDGLWHHVAVVLPAGATGVTHHRLYVDGRLDAVGSRSARAIDTASDADVRIGEDFSNRHFRGLMDDVRVYDRALSPGEIIILADPALLAVAGKAEKGIARKAVSPESPFDRLIAKFDALVMKGDHAGAGKLAVDAAEDPELAGSVEALTSAGKVCESLVARERAAAKAAGGLAGQELKLETREGQAKGKVKEASADGLVVLEEIVINRVAMGATKRVVRWADIAPEKVTELAEAGGWKPRTPDDHVALAVLAALWRKYEAAAESLDAAGDHPLVESYR